MNNTEVDAIGIMNQRTKRKTYFACAGFPQRRYTMSFLAARCFTTASVNVSHPLF
jgi:hypothetical protein